MHRMKGIKISQFGGSRGEYGNYWIYIEFGMSYFHVNFMSFLKEVWCFKVKKISEFSRGL